MILQYTHLVVSQSYKIQKNVENFHSQGALTQ